MNLFTPTPVDLRVPTAETIHQVHGYSFKIIDQIAKLPRVVTLQNEFMTFNAYISAYVKTDSECAVILDVVKSRLDMHSTGAAIILVNGKPYLIHSWSPADVKVSRKTISAEDLAMYDNIICLRHRFNASPTTGLIFKRHNKLISIETRCCHQDSTVSPTTVDYKTVIRMNRRIATLMEHHRSIALIDNTVRRMYTTRTHAIDDYHISRFRSLI